MCPRKNQHALQAVKYLHHVTYGNLPFSECRHCRLHLLPTCNWWHLSCTVKNANNSGWLARNPCRLVAHSLEVLTCVACLGERGSGCPSLQAYWERLRCCSLMSQHLVSRQHRRSWNSGHEELCRVL